MPFAVIYCMIALKSREEKIMKINRYFDHAVLKPGMSEQEVRDAIRQGLTMTCILYACGPVISIWQCPCAEEPIHG